MSNELVLERFNYGPDGTFGKLKFPNGEVFWTVERPWLGNKAYESCIPDGVYTLEKRYSPVVKSSSGGEFDEGYEITDVDGRTYIMIHVGNWVGDVVGCVAVGTRYGIMRDREGNWSNAVASSRDAFRKVMELLDAGDNWTIDIRPFMMSYP